MFNPKITSFVNAVLLYDSRDLMAGRSRQFAGSACIMIEQKVNRGMQIIPLFFL